jgi:hypothetical protein
MIYQSATNESIELSASIAGTIHWTCNASTITAGDGAPVAGAHGSLTTAAAVVISAAPGAGVHKQVSFISTCNKGAVANTVAVTKDVGGVKYTLFQAKLGIGETLNYTVDGAFKVLTADGAIKQSTKKDQTPAVLTYNYPVNKASLATQIAGQYASMWRATSLPAQGAVPATAAVCNASTLGAIPLAVRAGTQKRLLTGLPLAMSNVGAAAYVPDRLAHMGGLSGIVATVQNINLDVSLLTDNLPQRIGQADFSEVEWFMEWYTVTGATAVTPVIQCTHGDGTTGTAAIFNAGTAALPTSVAASRRYRVYANSGKPIKSLQSVTMPTTGTAGSFGFTAVRNIGLPTVGVVANRIEPAVGNIANAPEIFDNSCLELGMLCSTTTTGTIIGHVQQTVVQP